MDAQPEVIDTGSEIAALIAAGGGPTKPPKAWFIAAPPEHYEPPTREGAWIHGHLGKAGTCHIGIAGKCETIPTSATGYRYFHRTHTETAEGENVACGWLTMNTGHMPVSGNPTAMATMAHYDNTGTQVAKVRIQDTPHGPWMTGAIAPGLDATTLWKLEAPEVSGDWRDIDGHYRELVAVLGVPLPGFLTPTARSIGRVGTDRRQIGTLPCDSCDEEPAFVEDFPNSNRLSERLAGAEAALRTLRPVALAAMSETVSPPEMVEEAQRRAAAKNDPSNVWRAKLHV